MRRRQPPFCSQYYNALAKEMKTVSTARDMEYELKRDYLEKSNYYYSRKDRAFSSVSILRKGLISP